jgi:hypothetical protein
MKTSLFTTINGLSGVPDLSRMAGLDLCPLIAAKSLTRR